jgi:hypothetical protein
MNTHSISISSTAHFPLTFSKRESKNRDESLSSAQRNPGLVYQNNFRKTQNKVGDYCGLILFLRDFYCLKVICQRPD